MGTCKMGEREVNEEPQEVQEVNILDRNAILEANDVMVERVDVPEWGGSVFVRTILAGEWDSFEDSMVTIVDGVASKANLDDYRARFAAMILCDEQGNSLFDKNDIPKLSKKSRAAMDRVLEAGKTLNRVSQEDQEALVESLKPTLDGDSSCD